MSHGDDKVCFGSKMGNKETPYPLSHSSIKPAGTQISVTDNNLTHYLSGTILWDSRNLHQQEGIWLFLAPLKPPRESCFPWTYVHGTDFVHSECHQRATEEHSVFSFGLQSLSVSYCLELALSQPTSALPSDLGTCTLVNGPFRYTPHICQHPQNLF